MTKRKDVRQFLTRLKAVARIFGILYLDDRKKNLQTLSDLEITGRERDNHVMDLKIEDFSEGPIPEEFYGSSEMWVFGKVVRSQEVYIKITFGRNDRPVICISFHVAEHKMKLSF